jgi:hypothetical protein
MIRARTLGGDAEYIPRREVPALFSLTTAVSSPRELTLGGVHARINAGPSPRTCCGRPVRAGKLKDAAPHAAPAFAVEPRPGAALEERPWVRSGFRDQAPLSPWPRPTSSPDPAGTI